MSDQSWWLKGPIIAYASSKEGMANRVISVAQFDNALPKNRTEYDIPLGRVDQAKELAAARALLCEVERMENHCGIADQHGTTSGFELLVDRIRSYLDACETIGEKK